MTEDKVPCWVLRELFLRSGLTVAQVAGELGVNDMVVGRALGLWCVYAYRNLKSGRKEYKYFSKQVTYEKAVKIVRAMGMDPIDAGL